MCPNCRHVCHFGIGHDLDVDWSERPRVWAYCPRCDYRAVRAVETVYASHLYV